MSITLIPAIDIIDGQCVRLEEGDFARRTVYGGTPLEIAKKYEAAGFKRLHLVDLDGAKAGAAVHLDLLAEIASHTELTVDFGGGLSSEEIAAGAFDAGAAQINIGTAAVRNPKLFSGLLKRFGPDRIILSADTRDGIVQIKGWHENSAVSLAQVIEQFLPLGLKYVACTDIARDGMLTGPAVQLYRDLKDKFPALEIIASGGVASVDDLRPLDELGIHGVIIGKALLSGRLSLESVREYL